MPPNLLLQTALMEGNMIDAMNIMQQEERKWHYVAAEEERRRKEEQVRVYQPELIRYIEPPIVRIEPLQLLPIEPISVEPLLVNSSFRKRSEEREETRYFRMLLEIDELRSIEEIRMLKKICEW